MLTHSQITSVFAATPLPSLILYPDSDFTVADANEAFLTKTGATKVDLLGESIFDISLGEIPLAVPELKDILKKVRITQEAVTMKLPRAGNSGRDEIWYQLTSLTPVLDKSDAVDLIIFSFGEVQNTDLLTEENSSSADPGNNFPFDSYTSDNEKDKILQMLIERIKEQECLYKISNLDEQILTIPELLTNAVNILPRGWQYNEVAEAKIEYNGEIFTTAGYKETSWSMSAETNIRRDCPLAVKISYLTQRPIHDEGPFLKEERNLINSVINHLSLKIDKILTKEEWDEKQELLDKAYKLARIGTWEFDMQTHHLHWSPVTKEVHGFGEDYEPDVESTINLFKKGIHREIFAKAAHDAIEHAEPFDVELKIISGKGDERWIRATGEPEFEDGTCTKFYGISQDVSDRRQAEEDLLLRERRFRSLVQDGSDLIAILDSEANYTYVSPTSESILGIPADQFIGTNAFDYIHDEDKLRLSGLISDLSTGKRIYIPPYRFRDAEGNWRWIETTLTNMTKDPAVGGLIANSRDVTEQIHQQQQNLESLKEKETLLAEIHHRVKNNLAVVSGMMQLQATEEENDEIKDRLNDSIIRIKTMANIHEQLYQSNSFSKLAFAENIQALILNIKQTFQPQTDINIDFNCENIELNINQAIPCSLIVNEVITNIFKHAFLGREEGNIDINLSECENQRSLHLSISDDGIGFPEDLDTTKSSSLGLNLINVLSDQLHASHHYKSTDNKTTFVIEFEKDELKGIGNSLL
ncbi:PAS domain S-box protein [Aliifodinibius sp. S!AR15-10]|uniref:PAS domain-containing sensor histidine kinase n=1 Tax=Aliifodinibius sp. S!AR15-10 TaxID=2950437 RepID=UPI002858CBD6|nr:PAS domain S-box protein [Aliifodinibius sp. S!AR15-10]MDR8390139.1 PAS domain S-box protein [Aliifodinibius sp. S!AR15-10]